MYEACGWALAQEPPVLSYNLGEYIIIWIECGDKEHFIISVFIRWLRPSIYVKQGCSVLLHANVAASSKRETGYPL